MLIAFFDLTIKLIKNKDINEYAIKLVEDQQLPYCYRMSVFTA